MKKKLFALVTLIAGTIYAGTPTTRLGLDKTDDHTLNWGSSIRANYDIIDSSVAILSSTQTFTGNVTFSNVTVSSMSLTKVRISTANYSVSTDALAVNGTARIGGTSGALNVCDENFQHCAAYGKGSLSLSNTSTSGSIFVDGTAQGGIYSQSGTQGFYSVNNLNAPNLISAKSMWVGTTYGDRLSALFTPDQSFSAFEHPVVIGDSTPSGQLYIYNNNVSSRAVVIVSTGTGNAIRVTARGTPGAIQDIDGGAVNITVPQGSVMPNLVLTSSNTDSQLGAGILEIWQEATTHNDPHIWIHAKDHQSAGNIRIDSDAPNFEIVNTSTDNAHGFGKWEPFAAAYQSARMQVGSSRCYDNTGFNNLAYWEPMSKGGGLFLQAFDATGCESAAGFSTSSTTIPVAWFTLNGRTVGLKGPLNSSASWNFMLPSTFANGGQVLYQATSSGNRNWEFTVNGSSGTSLNFSSTSTAPFWGTPTLTSLTKAQISTAVPGLVGVQYYCSDCSTVPVCISTGTTVGSFSLITARASACN